MAESDSTGAPAPDSIISRKAATQAGAVRYFTGLSCKHGHIAPRLTINGMCCQCALERSRSRYHERREENLKHQKARRDSDPMLGMKKLARRLREDPGLAERIMSRKYAADNRERARANGERQYVASEPCEKGHQAIRFVRDYSCVECNRLMCLLRSPQRAHVLLSPHLMGIELLARTIKALARHKSKQLKRQKKALRARRSVAVAAGLVTYMGKDCPFEHGGMRYTAGGNCVECAREYSSSSAKKEYDRIYQQKNAARIRERNRRHRAVTAAQRTIAARQWTLKNPAKRKAISKTYKARRRQREIGGDATAAIAAWEARAIKNCHWCDVKCADNYHVDHYQPLSKGGMHVVSNLVIACPRCNLRKSAKDPFEFANQMGRLF